MSHNDDSAHFAQHGHIATHAATLHRAFGNPNMPPTHCPTSCKIGRKLNLVLGWSFCRRSHKLVALQRPIKTSFSKRRYYIAPSTSNFESGLAVSFATSSRQCPLATAKAEGVTSITVKSVRLWDPVSSKAAALSIDSLLA